MNFTGLFTSKKQMYQKRENGKENCGKYLFLFLLKSTTFQAH